MITINGTDIETLGVTLLQGTAENLLKLPTMKEAIINSSNAINGVQIDARNSRVDKRTVVLNIRLKGADETDYFTKYEALQRLLIEGKDRTGINELGFLKYKFRLRYESCDTLRILASNLSNLSLSFLEPDPTDRL